MIEKIHKVRIRLRQTGGYRWHVYAWRGGPSIGTIDALTFPKTLPAAIVHAYAEATKNHNAAPPETFASVINEYLHSAEWDALAPTTKKVWRRWIDKIRAKFGGASVIAMANIRMRGDIKKWRDKFKASPRSADMAVQVLHRIIAFGVDGGRMTANVASDINRLYDVDRSEIIWESHERAAFLAVASPSDGWILRLACATGLRAADLVAIPRSADKGYRFVFKTSKTGKSVIIPILPDARAVLDEIAAAFPQPADAPIDLRAPILRGAKGRPITAQTAGEKITATCDKLISAGIMDERKHLHDCRGSFATELMLSGATDDEAAELLGWETARIKKIRRRYVDGKAVAGAIVERLEAYRRAKQNRDA